MVYLMLPLGRADGEYGQNYTQTASTSCCREVGLIRDWSQCCGCALYPLLSARLGPFDVRSRCGAKVKEKRAFSLLNVRKRVAVFLGLFTCKSVPKFSLRRETHAGWPAHKDAHLSADLAALAQLTHRERKRWCCVGRAPSLCRLYAAFWEQWRRRARAAVE